MNDHPTQDEGKPAGYDPYVQPPPTQAIFPSQPVPQPQFAPSQPTNGLAIASLVLGIVWVWWIGSLLALIFGYTALRDIKRTGHGGKGMAVAGIVLGWIGAATLVIALIAMTAGASGIGSSTDTPSPGFEPAPASELAVLHDECAAGNMVSCDELYLQSPAGSAEEEFGDDCGGRGHQVGVWCSTRYDG